MSTRRKYPIALYDWAVDDFEKVRGKASIWWRRIARDRRWEVLIYQGRHLNNEEDPGIRVKEEKDHHTLRTLYERGYLTGRALDDARTLFPDIPTPKQRPAKVLTE